MARPELSTVPSFYHNYIKLVDEDDVNAAMSKNTDEAFTLLESIPEEKWNYRYAEGKWSIKELVQHIIDAERIFCYRALCFARKNDTELPGFDENEYAAASKAESRSKNELLEEFKVVRRSAEILFSSFDDEQLKSIGTANQNKISVLAIGFIVAGHTKHHLNILKERYKYEV